MASILEELVEDAKLRCGSKQSERLKELNEAYQYSNAMLIFISTFVLRAENRGVCCGSDLESRTELRNGLDFEIHSFESSPDNGH